MDTYISSFPNGETMDNTINEKMTRVVLTLTKNGSTYTLKDKDNATVNFAALYDLIDDESNYVVILYGQSKLRPQYVSANEIHCDGEDFDSDGVFFLRMLMTPTSLSYQRLDLANETDTDEMREDINNLNKDLTELQRGGYIADQQQIGEKVSDWLDEHPEATTKDYVTPEMFGAVGDGVTDDSAALQSAVDFLAEKTGGCLMLGAKVYAVSTPINISHGSVTISGVGHGSNFAYGFENGKVSVLKALADAGSVLNITKANSWTFNITLKDFTIDCNNRNQCGVNISRSMFLTMQNVFVCNSHSDGVIFDRVYVASLININTRNCGDINNNKYAVRILGSHSLQFYAGSFNNNKKSIYAGDNSFVCHFTNSYFEYDDGDETYCPQINLTSYSENFVFDGCSFVVEQSNNNEFFHCESGSHKIINSNFEGLLTNTIYPMKTIQGRRSPTIHNCNFKAGVIILNFVGNYGYITGCTFEGNVVITVGNNAIITGNTFLSEITTPITIGTNCRINDNVLSRHLTPENDNVDIYSRGSLDATELNRPFAYSDDDTQDYTVNFKSVHAKNYFFNYGATGRKIKLKNAVAGCEITIRSGSAGLTIINDTDNTNTITVPPVTTVRIIYYPALNKWITL